MTTPNFTYKLRIEQAFPEDGLYFGTAEAWEKLITDILNEHLRFAKVVEIEQIEKF